jgi:hypothetical protein
MPGAAGAVFPPPFPDKTRPSSTVQSWQAECSRPRIDPSAPEDGRQSTKQLHSLQLSKVAASLFWQLSQTEEDWDYGL